MFKGGLVAWRYADFILDEDGFLSAAPRVFGVRTDVLYSEYIFSSDSYEGDWEEVRSAYLSLRHTVRFHQDEWESQEDEMPACLNSLVSRIRTLLEIKRDLLTEFMDLPDIAVVWVLPEHRVQQALLMIVSDEERIRAECESGLLFVLILRSLELINTRALSERNKITKPKQNVGTAILRINKIVNWTWLSTNDLPCMPPVFEGTLEDMAWVPIAHGGPTTVVASCEASGSYLATSYTSLLGRHPTRIPRRGEAVEICNWGSVERNITIETDLSQIWNFSTNTLNHSALDREITIRELHEEGNNDIYVLESIDWDPNYGPLYSFWLRVEGWVKFPS